MKGKFSVLLATLLLATTLSFNARAAIVYHAFEDLTDFVVFIPCANGGAGEEVVFNGILHVLITLTLDGKGGFHGKTHFQPQGVQAFGTETGALYNATGVTQDNFNGKVGEVYTFVNSFKIIGQGRGNNYLVQNVYHITVNANGEVSVEHEILKVDCK